VQRARQFADPHRHDRLDHPADPGRGLGVADVRLERPQPDRPPGRAVQPVGVEDGLGLNRVPEDGAGAVRLDRVDVAGGKARVGQRLADDPFLGRAVGGGQPVAGTVLIDGGAADDPEDLIPVGLGLAQALEHQEAHALAPAGPVGGGAEGLAPPVAGERPLPTELGERAGGGHHCDAAG